MRNGNLCPSAPCRSDSPRQGAAVWAKYLTLAAVFAGFLLLFQPSASAAFTDIPPDHWCAGPIAQLEQRGYVAGYADGTFRPAKSVTAAQFVTIAARCTGLEPIPDAENQWATGAVKSHWAAGTMAAALRAGWYDWDELPPTGEKYDQPLTRVLAVKIVMRSLLPEARGDYLTESAKIRDFDQLDGRYYESVLAAYASGVVQGDSAGRFNPRNGLTRAAACALIARALAQRDAAAPASPTPPANPENPANPPAPATPTPPPVPSVPADSPVRGGVSENGWLKVNGARLRSQDGTPILLRGMSSHGLQWYGQYAAAAAMANTAAWGANLFRVAMYTAEGGYLSNPADMEQKVYAAIDAAIARDLYVILDWHILSDGNPLSHADEAAAFFTRAAERYRDSPAVLYEICNEPNGNVTWERDIKPYAARIVSVIREQSPKAVILIGSGTWSQDIHLAAQSPLDGENLMYTLHFYAGTHGADLRQRLRDAVNSGLPVFVTEWGTSQADGSGGVFPEETGIWLDLLDELGISWANWSLCDKNETSAALKPGTSPDRPWTSSDLSASGTLVFARFCA